MRYYNFIPRYNNITQRYDNITPKYYGITRLLSVNNITPRYYNIILQYYNITPQSYNIIPRYYNITPQITISPCDMKIWFLCIILRVRICLQYRWVKKSCNLAVAFLGHKPRHWWFWCCSEQQSTWSIQELEFLAGFWFAFGWFQSLVIF
jgi:hypothetical protein